jgi:hypothetical protein
MAICNILWRLGYFMTILYILCSFGTFFPFWYRVPRKKTGNPAKELFLVQRFALIQPNLVTLPEGLMIRIIGAT